MKKNTINNLSAAGILIGIFGGFALAFVSAVWGDNKLEEYYTEHPDERPEPTEPKEEPKVEEEPHSGRYPWGESKPKHAKSETADAFLNAFMNAQSTCDYGKALDAVMKSDMWSSDKMRIQKIMSLKGDQNYYSGIISIVNAGMWSSDKVEAVKVLTAKLEG